MGKITIISKNPGKGIYSSEDETWEYLNKLVEGDLTENAENIIIKTTDNEIPSKFVEAAAFAYLAFLKKGEIFEPK